MTAAGEGDLCGDVMHLLRSGTAAEHQSVERSLDLLDPTSIAGG